MKLRQIHTMLMAAIIAVTMTACGDTKDVEAAPTEMISEEIPMGAKEEMIPEQISNAEEETAAENTEKPVEDSQNNIASETLYGDIKTIDDDSFVISKTTVESDGNGGEIMAIPIDDAGEELITVHYDDQTSIIITTSTDGMTSTKTAGSKADLVKGSSVTLEGSWDKDVFRAANIDIFILAMD